MPALRPIQYDWVAEGRPSLEDRYRLRQRETPRQAPAAPLASNPLGRALAGTKTSGGGRIRGGTFAPRATSGML